MEVVRNKWKVASQRFRLAFMVSWVAFSFALAWQIMAPRTHPTLEPQTEPLPEPTPTFVPSWPSTRPTSTPSRPTSPPSPNQSQRLNEFAPTQSLTALYVSIFAVIFAGGGSMLTGWLGVRRDRREVRESRLKEEHMLLQINEARRKAGLPDTPAHATLPVETHSHRLFGQMVAYIWKRIRQYFAAQ